MVYIGIICVCILSLWLIYKRKKANQCSEKDKIRNDVLKESLDINNVIYSSFNAASLYDKLKKKYHPDRFIDESQKAKADLIFQQITQYKRDYNKLLELEKIAEQELNKNR